MKRPELARTDVTAVTSGKVTFGVFLLVSRDKGNARRS